MTMVMAMVARAMATATRVQGEQQQGRRQRATVTATKRAVSMAMRARVARAMAMAQSKRLHHGDVLFLGCRLMRPIFLVGPVLPWHERYVQNFCFCMLCLWMGSSTFQEFLGGKGMFLCFYVFMLFENESVDKALAMMVGTIYGILWDLIFPSYFFYG
jgi:hypothetical protein